jgi:DNA-binding response OmpR family regulator
VENIQAIVQILEALYPEAKFYQATEGKSALELCESTRFDLVISDWDMPGISGIDLIRSLKADVKTRHIPIIIVTAIMLTSKDLDIALSAGAHDYIRNPVDPLELTARVSAALTLSRCHQEEIKKKDVELLEKTLIHVKNNEFDIEFSKGLHKLTGMCSNDPGALAQAQRLIHELEQKIREDSWKSFEVSFQNIHSDFLRNLLATYPQLTSAEVRLCLLLKLGMNIKDMASMLYQTQESLKVSRSRLRSKLSIGRELSFQSFFASF